MPFNHDKKRLVKTPLTKDQVKAILELFLSESARPQHTMNFYQLDGYLRAITIAPDPIDAEDWTPLVFADQNPNFDSDEQASFITEALNSLYNIHKVQLLSQQCDLPCSNVYTADRSFRINIEQWARGFMQGFIICQDRWNFFLDGGQTATELPDIIKNRIYDEIDAMLAFISGVADADYALSQGVSIDELQRMFNQLPEQLVSYGKAGQLLRKYM